MNQYYQQIVQQIKKFTKNELGFILSSNYSGSTHKRYGLTVPESRSIAKEWAKKLKDITKEEFIDLLDSLYQGESVDEKKIASQILEYSPKLRGEVEADDLDNWLDHLQGWEEIDSSCQSVFNSKDLLANWGKWEKLITKFAQDENIAKKRASLVLLTGVGSQSDDKRLSNLAFKNISLLKGEKNILITKAISWLLRDLIKNHREKVKEYLKQNSATLPKIAVREVVRKLETGKK